MNVCWLIIVSDHFMRIHIQTPVYLFHTQDKSRWWFPQLGVSKNRGVSPQIIHLFIGFSTINHPFWWFYRFTPIFGNPQWLSKIRKNIPRPVIGQL